MRHVYVLVFAALIACGDDPVTELTAMPVSTAEDTPASPQAVDDALTVLEDAPPSPISPFESGSAAGLLFENLAKYGTLTTPHR